MQALYFRRAMTFLAMFFGFFVMISCEEAKTHPEASRAEKIPIDVEKRTPETDYHPPILHALDFETPVPLFGPINTAGLEDSPFITEDGNTLYFFFTPDAKVEPSKQLLDDVTGIWISEKIDGIWQEPKRVWLQKPGKLALDGCPMLYQDTLWFCSAREGYTGVKMFHTTLGPMMWMHVVYSGDHLTNAFEMGEMHRHGNDIYFHSMRQGGKGGYDIWVTSYENDTWTDPINLEIINTEANEALPFVSYDGKELWFTRTHMGTPSLFRSMWSEGSWQAPELIISVFAGEPTLDGEGNLYFVHHFFEHDQMIEADIYVAKRIKS